MSQQQPGQTAEGRRQLSRGMSNHEVGLSRSGSRSGSRGGTSIVHGGLSSRDALSLRGGTNTPSMVEQIHPIGILLIER